MPVLNEKEIKYGFDYFHKDEPRKKAIVEVAQYNGEDSLTINCTQLGDVFTSQYKTQKEKKRVVQEWCDFLNNNTTAFTELSFGTKMPQELFNAVCSQKNLKKLDIKWGLYPDISMIANLSGLEYLHIGSGAGVQDIEPVSSLKKLIALTVENFQNIEDYKALSKLQNLESLSIKGDILNGKDIHVNSLDFLTDMKQLRFFYCLRVLFRSKDITPVLSLINIEHLTLPPKNREVRNLYNEIIRLPKLKYGRLIDNPESYTSKIMS